MKPISLACDLPLKKKQTNMKNIKIYSNILHKYTCINQVLLSFSDIALLGNTIVCGYHLNTSFN